MRIASFHRSVVLGLILMIGVTGPVAAEDIVIGQVAPFTGTLAPTGIGVRTGIEAYLARVNADGGIHKQRVRLVTRDDAYQIDKTLEQTRALLAEQHPVALIGFVGTGNTLALNRDGLLEKAGIALVGVRSGASALRRPVPPTIFHTRASYAAEVRRVVSQMHSMGLKRVAVFHQDDPFGQDGLAAARTALADAGITLVATGAYAKGSTEVSEAVRTIHAADPNGVIMVSNTAASAAFVKQLREAGSYALLIALSVTTGPQVADKIGTALAHGLGVVQVVPDPASEAVPISRELGEDLRRIGVKAPANHTMLEGYLMARVLVEAMRRSERVDRPSILATLEHMGRFDAGGLTIRYSPSDHDGAEYTDISILDRNGHLLR
ncbi:ABC transporter substrate-binding protein [Nitrogeniibacter mangrovi]|uniref:ABC transporter substrate-binding protein n=1 Tax=Nitrogeniibacter mangrovi TaxID=2016596 RepID=A0A6C1B4C8_9RHOO|nr:ABC transporter substrate-binding protein [Nitrogeniibacter mangrovi]QID17859.1 ABC transporter substrate-binding protein [Nitrogeniibacter mangrovi]